MTTVKQRKKISMHCHGKKAELWFGTNYSHGTTNKSNLIFVQKLKWAKFINIGMQFCYWQKRDWRCAKVILSGYKRQTLTYFLFIAAESMQCTPSELEISGRLLQPDYSSRWLELWTHAMWQKWRQLSMFESLTVSKYR